MSKRKAIPMALSAGFTIVELLIVVVIIGVLAAIIIAAYNGVVAHSRDSSRGSAVLSIKKVMELYLTDNGQYPAVCPGGDGFGCDASLLGPSLITYTSAIPQDPQYPTKKIQYVRGGANSYGLYILYENKPICKTGINVAAGWWGVGVPMC